jgi:hypothetical protein
LTVDPHTIEFKAVAGGDCFAFRDNYYVKLNTASTVQWSGMLFNAVELGSGAPIHFQEFERVTRFPKARIVTE